jgi:hypothetical protein
VGLYPQSPQWAESVKWISAASREDGVIATATHESKRRFPDRQALQSLRAFQIITAPFIDYKALQSTSGIGLSLKESTVTHLDVRQDSKPSSSMDTHQNGFNRGAQLPKMMGGDSRNIRWRCLCPIDTQCAARTVLESGASVGVARRGRTPSYLSSHALYGEFARSNAIFRPFRITGVSQERGVPSSVFGAVVRI